MLIHDDLKISSVKDLLTKELSIPPYQRPYRWTTDTAIVLFSDTYNAFLSKVFEYRMGSVVIHKHDGKLEIVDGQQRLTTLTILVFCIFKRLNEPESNNELVQLSGLLNANYNDLSTIAIVNNYKILSRMINEISINAVKDYLDYLLNKCTMVQIVTDSEQEAFQFFDSQNSRGRALIPHDLLKSFHLREMNDIEEKQKIEIIDRWESTKQKDLEKLFADNLYPLVRWYKYLDGLGYSTKKINTFKGVKKSSIYNFAMYNRAANLYIERFNQECMYELVSGKTINQFQLTQPIIAGRRFFEYSLHYLALKTSVEKRIDFNYKERGQLNLMPEDNIGDGYVKNLFVNVVMFFVDRFNISELTDYRLDLLYRWAYSIRLVMKAVYKESINLYAEGNSERVNKGLNMFARISEMQDPSELDSILLNEISKKDVEKYKVNMNKYSDIFNYMNK